MGFIRRYFLYLLLIGAFGYAYFEHPPQPCDKPIEYSLSNFDKRFGVSQADFLSATKQAGEAWSKLIDKNLFEYNPNGKLVLNLVYDDRQATTQKNQVLESVANQNKGSADSIKIELDGLEAIYKTDNKTYLDLSNSFGVRQTKYNSDVDFYNGQGGAPKDIYNQLMQEKQTLSGLSADLELKRVALNALGDKINALVKKHNEYVDTANAKINVLNQSAGKEFNEGEYVTDERGERINIYEFTSKTKLERILEHELGHALGLEHGTDPIAIMYYLNQAENLTPTAEDKSSLEKVCATPKTYLQQAIIMIQSKKTGMYPSL